MFRTLWGLWQLNCFRSWAKNSILALKAIGITYRLPGMRHGKQKKDVADEPVTAAYVVDHILVNEKIIDNQIMHGHLHSYLAYRDIDVLTHADDKIHLLDPFYGAAQWIRIFLAFVCDRLLSLCGHSRKHSLRQVPLKPVEVWVHWAAAFAAQGLKDWLSEFDVVPDPDAQPYDHSLTALDRLRRRGRYFSTQVLASATLQLWPDHEYGQGSGPFLWDAWPAESHMSDGRVVKQELFELAIRSGRALPFRVPHLKDLEGLEEYDDLIPYGYDAYREVLTEFITELPVKWIHVREIREFDINKLEWLTILIYMGMLSRQCKAKQRECRKSVESTSTSSSDHSSSSSSSSSSDSSVAVYLEHTCSNVDSDQAIATLRAQLNVPNQPVSRNRPARKHLYTADNGLIRSAFPIGMNLISLPSINNRLVAKVGELIDVWMALVSGAQVSFLVKELNEEWRAFCLAPDNIELCEIGQTMEECGTRVRAINYELEKRRLERRIADQTHKYKFMDQFITFMGYRMESLRSSLARWVNRNEGKSGDDFFNTTNKKDFRELEFRVPLSRAIVALLEGSQYSEVLNRRCVQCRLIWELQNFLESILLPHAQLYTYAEDDVYVATIMLFVLSFPSLHVKTCAKNESCNVQQSESKAGGLDPTSERSGTFGNFELESKGLLQQPCIVGYKTPLIRDDVGGVISNFVDLPVKRVQSVRYEEADDAVLMHTCLLVQDAVRDHYNLSNPPSSIGVEGNAVDIMMRLASTLEPSRASTLYEMAALQHGNVDALMKCMELLFDFGENSEDCYRGLDILRSFVATMLSKTAVSVEVADEDKAKFREHVLPACENVLRLEGDKGYVYQPLMDILNAYLVCDPQDHNQEASLAMQKLLFLTQTNRAPLRALCDIAQAIACVESAGSGNESICRVLEIEPERFSVENGRTRLGLLKMAVDKGAIHLRSRGLSKHILTKQAGYEDIRKSCAASRQQKLAVEELGYVRAIYSLAVLLAVGTTGVAQNAPLAAKLYERLISEWNDPYAMFNLGLLLEKGGEGLNRDIGKAIALYEKAIYVEQNAEAMFSLALLRHYGAEGFNPNLKEAIVLYKQAIDRGNHIGAMYNLATIWQTGGDGVDPDPRAAMSLYERVLSSRKHVHAMYNLATLLQSEIDGLQPNPGRAVELYESLAQEEDVNAMYALADLLLTARDGMLVDVAKAKLYIRKAVVCHSSVEIGAEHMRKVWDMLRSGSKWVEMDTELCAAIEMHARQSGIKLH
ncbi:Sel1-repeat containing protein [Gracilaria domingensis]|nr:Sel1-repeat containing protein [Gracilaria domingensis]